LEEDGLLSFFIQFCLVYKVSDGSDVYWSMTRSCSSYH
jgi:hypothetical protein